MSDARSFLIIVNPTSGRGRGLRMAGAIAEILGDRGAGVAVRETAGPGEAERIAREVSSAEQSRPTCVVGCGGDGTLQEIANALAALKDVLGSACPVMGLAPAGRCNDFARELGVRRDPVAIADVLLRGEPRAIDLGRVNDRCFCTVATMGADAEVSSYVDTMKMPLRGTIAYIYGALRVLSRYRGHRVRITGDFGVIDQPVFLASSANTSSYGGAIKIAPGADPTDGKLDLCVIDQVSRLRAFSILWAVLSGRHRGRSEVRFIRTQSLRIEADEPLEVWADGERVAHTPVDIEVVPEAIQVLVPTAGGLADAAAGDRPAMESP